MTNTKKTIESGRLRLVFQIGLLLLFFVGIYYLIAQLGEFSEIFHILQHSSWLWLIAGTIAMTIALLLMAYVQYIAGSSIGTYNQLLILEFAGTFLNRLLPFSIAGIGITSEFYRRHGQNRSKSLIIATVPTVFWILTMIVILVIISPISFSKLITKMSESWNPTIAALIAVAVITVLVIVLIVFRKRIRHLIDEAIQGIKALRSSRQLVLITIGSIGITLLYAFMLYASVMAIGHTIAIGTAIVLFITSLLIGNIAPTPGGLGATEATLIIGLTAAGLTLEQAVASTVIFRFITYWLPLLPGSFAVRKLNQRRKKRPAIAKK